MISGKGERCKNKAKKDKGLKEWKIIKTIHYYALNCYMWLQVSAMLSVYGNVADRLSRSIILLVQYVNITIPTHGRPYCILISHVIMVIRHPSSLKTTFAASGSW